MYKETKTGDGAWNEASEAVRNVQRMVHRFVNDLSREVHEAPDVKVDWSCSVNPGSEVIEEDERLRVLVDLPGIDEKDIEVSLLGNRLVVEGERKHPAAESGERSASGRYGPFRKEISLPCEVSEEGIDATLKAGVLEVLLPRKQKKSGVKINVKKK